MTRCTPDYHSDATDNRRLEATISFTYMIYLYDTAIPINYTITSYFHLMTQ